MIAMLVAFFIAFLSFNFFMVSYQVNGINRLVTGMPIALYETAINMFDINEETGPCFDKITLEDNLTSYFDFHMPRYVDGYDISFYYYNIADHSFDLDDECQAVEVTIETTLIMFKHYQKTMFYEIRSN